jgi:putative heme degradation protein
MFNIALRMAHQNSIIGLNVDQAVKLLGDNYTIRVVNKDGKSLCYFADYDPSRWNVYVVNDIVTQIESRG